MARELSHKLFRCFSDEIEEKEINDSKVFEIRTLTRL